MTLRSNKFNLPLLPNKIIVGVKEKVLLGGECKLNYYYYY